jgi:hypothetical protein
MPETSHLVVAIALSGALAWAFLRWRRARHFIWRVDSISISVEQWDARFRIGQYLNLDQQLRPKESGWTNMKIDIPKSWKVQSFEVSGSQLVISLADGTHYHLNRRNVGRLTFDILDGEKKSDAELETIWRRYALA